MRVLVLLGPPGVGKGTAAERIVKEFDFHWLSTGKLLRDFKTKGGKLGEEIAGYIDRGEFVPDDLIVELVGNEVSGLARHVDRLLLDGFPRTIPQAVALDQLADGVDLALELTASHEEIERRIMKRSESENRPDDSLETLRRRLEVYDRLTNPVVEHYRQQQVLVEVSAMGSADVVFDRVAKHLEKCFPNAGS